MPGESITRAGVILYGLASVACDIMDCIWGDFDASHQPIQAFGDHISGVTILAYITASWMIAGGFALLLRRSARAGGAVLAIIYFGFAIFWLPRPDTAPHYLGFRIPVFIGVTAGIGIEFIACAGGALVRASMAPRSSSWPRTILITRWIFALCAINFGVNYLDAVADNLFCAQVDAFRTRFLGDPDRNLFRPRRPCHTVWDSGRPGRASACPDVFGFQCIRVAAFHFRRSQGSRCLGRQRVQPGFGGCHLDIRRRDRGSRPVDSESAKPETIAGVGSPVVSMPGYNP
jgi:hypothetical protein